MGDPRKFAAAVAVRRNNQSGGSIPKARSLVGGASTVGPEPAGDYDEVDTLHRALGSAIVDKVMKSREEKLSQGGFVEGTGDNFLEGDAGDSEEEYDSNDQSYDVQGGVDEQEGEDETGEGEGGTRSQGPILQNIFSKLRKRHMGR